MFPAYFLAFSTGYLSLGLEILWVRLFAFANHSLPQAFAFVLMSYLFGIALGAQIGKTFCDRYSNLWAASGIVLLISSFFDVLNPCIYIAIVKTPYQVAIAFFLIALTAFFKAILFPIAHHLGTSTINLKIGHAISKVYVSNIMGATLGPIMVGYVLLSFLTTQQVFIVCGGLSFLVGIYCLRGYLKPFLVFASVLFIFTLQAILLTIQPNGLTASIAQLNNMNLKKIIETRQGIISIYNDGKADDIIFGGNVYDGRTNLDPIRNTNQINRLIVLSALQKKPKRILMIGLSIGTWLKIITSFPNIKHIDVVEINPGYLEAIKNYPPQQSALSDPRVKIYIDDARRWLKAHPNETYDLVVMNTTYHWRAYSANLLSQEFLKMIKSHMNWHAVLTYNTTDSLDAFKTAGNVFSYAYLYLNFVIAADFDWRKELHAPDAKQKLIALTMDGHPLFPVGSDKIIYHYLNLPLISFKTAAAKYDNLSNLLFLNKPIEIITDRNLISEYKHGKQL